MFIRISCFALVFCIILVCIPSASAVTVYDAQAAFAAAQPTPSNPIGQFTAGRFSGSSVGAGPTLTPGTFIPFDTFSETLAGTVLDGFTDSGLGTDPNVLYNDSGVTETMYGLTIVPGQMAISPFQGPAVLRFTAPAAGFYDIDASYTDTTQSVNTDGQAFVFVNGTQVYTDVADVLASYSGSFFLGSGDTVDFILAGSSLGYGNKTTGLTATLTFTPPAPEPTSLTLLGMGVLGMMVRRRRR